MEIVIELDDGEPYTGPAVVVNRGDEVRFVSADIHGRERLLASLDDSSINLPTGAKVQVEEDFLISEGPPEVIDLTVPSTRKGNIVLGENRFARPQLWSLGGEHNRLWETVEVMLIASFDDGKAPQILVRHGHPVYGTGDQFVKPEVWSAHIHRLDESARLEKDRNKQLLGEFVNPYNFVSLPEGSLVRRKGRGHLSLVPEGADAGLMGKITMRWTARSPIMAPSPTQGGADEAGMRKFLRSGQTPIIPGASMKGLIRSTHEALCAGCLRVLDPDYVPVHREQVSNMRKGWPMVMVAEVDDHGVPTSVRVSSDVIWADSGLLNPANKGRPSTGTRFTLDLGTSQDGLLRRPKIDGKVPDNTPKADAIVEYQAIATPDPAGDWYLLVSDTNARSPKNKTYFALGRFDAASLTVGVDPAAAAALRRRAEGSNDVRNERGGHGHTVDVDDKHGRSFRRAVVDLEPRPGSLLWADLDGDRVVQLSISQVWRYEGKFPVRERVGDLGPCASVDRLCPTCRLFGATDDRSENRNEQNGYRSHLRFGTARLIEGQARTPPDDEPRLAPLGPPRPSAGQNYLEATKSGKTSATHRSGDRADDPPLANWGSEADQSASGVRQIRGRKFYWHGSAEAQQGYWTDKHQSVRRRDQASATHRPKVTRPAPETLPPGSVLEATVWFENLALIELGEVLAALDPNLIRTALSGGGSLKPPVHASQLGTSEDLLVHIGGGKPLGFGSARPSVETLECETAASRYGGDERPSIGVEDAVAAFVDAATETQRAGWPEFYALHHASWADPALIWYPPAEKWDSIGDDGSGQKKFDESFKYFARSAGKAFDKPHDAEAQPFTPLPRATDDPTQSIDPGVK